METHGRYSSQLFETCVCYAGRMTAYMVVKRDATMCSAILRTAWRREAEPGNDLVRKLSAGSVGQPG